MRNELKALQAMKIFAKHLGVPEAIMTDASAAKTSRDVRDFCIKIGTVWKKLEEGVPWANLAELYIGLLKSSGGKGHEV